MGNDITNNQEFCPQHGYPLPCSKCSYQPSQLVPSPELLTDEEIKDKILSLDIAKECYAYYYKILYDKYLQLLKCHQSEAAEIATLQADIEELNILSRCNSEVYDTRIKEDAHTRLELAKAVRKIDTNWDTRNIKSKFTSEEILGHIEVLSKSFYDKYAGKGLTPSEVMELHKSEYWELVINFIEAPLRAEIAELKVDIEELNILAKTNNDAYSAKISELLERLGNP